MPVAKRTHRLARRHVLVPFSYNTCAQQQTVAAVAAGTAGATGISSSGSSTDGGLLSRPAAGRAASTTGSKGRAGVLCPSTAGQGTLQQPPRRPVCHHGGESRRAMCALAAASSGRAAGRDGGTA